MAPANVRDRDAGMRRISTATRWMAGVGLGLTAALTGFFAARAQNASTTTSTPSSPNTAVSPGDDGSSQIPSAQIPSAQAPDTTSPSNNGGSSGGGGFSFPRSHTRTRGS
jgi:hypothetical protein